MGSSGGARVGGLAAAEGVTLYHYGHSLGVAWGDVDGNLGHTYPARVARRLGMTVKNCAIGGSKMLEAAFVAIQKAGVPYMPSIPGAIPYPAGQRGVVSVDCGLNDYASVGNDPLAVSGYGQALRAFCAQATRAKRIDHDDASIVYSAGWQNNAGVNGNHGIGGTPGATVDVPGITTDAAYYLGFCTDHALFTGASVTASVGGVPLATFSVDNLMRQINTQIPGGPALTGAGPFVKKITGIGGTDGAPKTLRLTVNDAGFFWFLGIIMPSTTPPLVLVGKDGHTNSPGYDFTDAAKAAYDAAADLVIAEFPTARPVDHVAAGWNPKTMTVAFTPGTSPPNPDNIHPNDLGASTIANAYVQAIAAYLANGPVAGVNY